MRITLPDNSVREYPAENGVTPAKVAADIGPGLAKAAIGAKVDGALWDLNRPLDHDCKLAIVTRPKLDKDGKTKGAASPDALYLLRHSAAHVMAEAICRLYPATKLAYGPPVDNGFYYDLALETPISSDDFAKIEAEMKKIVAENRPFTRYELPPESGLNRLTAEGNQYKIDNARRAIAGGSKTLSWYVTGQPDKDFEDLCMGPHVPATGAIGAFKVMSIASSNWHGDVHSDRFQRVYGTAFFSQADLDAHLAQLEEAKQRDHRVLGTRLGLFAVDEMVGQGLILWKPAGAALRQELQKFISEHLRRQGYQQVFTPHVGKLDLFKTSGHFPYYQDKQYPPMIDHEQLKALAAEGCTCADLANRMRQGEIDGYLLKPMNCPFHIKIFASEPRSYRDLPIRLAEFGTVYRWEQSGEIGGMTRVRGFTQDDAHLFVTEDQVDAELMGCLELVKIVFGTLGMNEYRVRIGLRDPDSSKYVGDKSQWDKAEAACRRAAESLGVAFSVEPGEAAFYGPKIDFVVRDVIGREWQLGTVQVDYQLPQRFDLSYIGADNQPHRPVMIHRAPFGSMERFCGVLIEHFNGAFPLWLSPEQVRVLPISDKFNEYGRKVATALQTAGFRATLDDSGERVQAKIKVAQDLKINYMLVVGGRDQDAGTVSVRDRARGDLGAMPLQAFVDAALAEARSYGKQAVAVPTV
jgi:threonyl-tRNA synthetase